MELIELQSKDELNSFVTGRADSRGAEFLQAWFWGEVEAKNGRVIKRLAVRETGADAKLKTSAQAAAPGKILAVATLIRKPLPAGFFYWYSPRGPLGEIKAVEFLVKEIHKKYHRAVFLRLEPTAAVTLTGLSLNQTLDVQPKQSLVIDLVARDGRANSEEEILAAMHQKTRYNIRLAEKKGIAIVEGLTQEVAGDKNIDFEEFWRLMSLTGERDAFRLHGREHYFNLLSGGVSKQGAPASAASIKLYFACYEGKNIAAGIFSFFGDKVTYLHGASDNNLRNLMAPYLLQWGLIKRAKIEGYKYYDFFGIDENKWPGVTRFKLGFGGRRIIYPGTYDVIFKPVLYNLYNFLRRLKRKRISGGATHFKEIGVK